MNRRKGLPHWIAAAVPSNFVDLWRTMNIGHWAFRAVFTLIPDLNGLEVIWINPFTFVVRRVLRRCVSAAVKSYWAMVPAVFKSRECEEEMRSFLSDNYRCNANKVRRQTRKLNVRFRVEVYFIYDLWITSKLGEFKRKSPSEIITLRL